MAAKTFAEWWEQDKMKSRLYLEIEPVWEAATKAAEARFTATNKRSPTILRYLEMAADALAKGGPITASGYIAKAIAILRASA